MKRTKMPRDVNQRAKLTIDWATGQADPESLPAKDPAAIARGHAGGVKGGTARATKLSPERRREIARKAAAARWQKHSPAE
jgi:hypothetical protein